MFGEAVNINEAWIALILATAGLVGACAKWVTSRIAKLSARNDAQHAENYGLLQSIDTRLETHGSQLGAIHTRLERVDGRLEIVEYRLDHNGQPVTVTSRRLENPT